MTTFIFMFMQNLTKPHKLPKNVFNRYRTERTFASTHILALKKSRSKAGQSSAYLRFSLALNRHRRGLETCPQANLAKSGHAIFYSFFRRVRATSMTQRRLENTRVHFWTFSPVSVKNEGNLHVKNAEK